MRMHMKEDLERMRASGFEVKQIVMADSISKAEKRCGLLNSDWRTR